MADNPSCNISCYGTQRQNHCDITERSYVVKKSAEIPKMDPRGLIEEYKNFVRAKDIHLSKLSLCEIGLNRTPGDYHEVCSVLLS